MSESGRLKDVRGTLNRAEWSTGKCLISNFQGDAHSLQVLGESESRRETSTNSGGHHRHTISYAGGAWLKAVYTKMTGNGLRKGRLMPTGTWLKAVYTKMTGNDLSKGRLMPTGTWLKAVYTKMTGNGLSKGRLMPTGTWLKAVYTKMTGNGLRKGRLMPTGTWLLKQSTQR